MDTKKTSDELYTELRELDMRIQELTTVWRLGDEYQQVSDRAREISLELKRRNFSYYGDNPKEKK